MILEYNKDSTLSRYLLSIVEKNNLKVELIESSKTVLKIKDKEITNYSDIEHSLQSLVEEKIKNKPTIKSRVHISDSVCISCEG